MGERKCKRRESFVTFEIEIMNFNCIKWCLRYIIIIIFIKKSRTNCLGSLITSKSNKYIKKKLK